MTGHSRGGGSPCPDAASLFAAFRESIRPLAEAGKLTAVLFQYPPWFDCTRANVAVLRAARDAMGDLPLALEFRHQSWFTAEMRERTLRFMAEEGWAHSVCDEPQAGVGSVPIVAQATSERLTVVRFHGRNTAGWSQASAPNWREVRYLYRYREAELLEWKERLLQLAQQSEQVAVIFNNNSGGDAADNAKQLLALLGLDYAGLAPRQLDLF